MDSSSSQTSAQYFKSLSTIFYFFILSILGFGLAAFFLAFGTMDAEAGDGLAVFMNYFIPVLVIVAIVLSTYFFRKKIASVNPGQDLSEKLEVYSEASLLRLSMMEFAALVAVVAFFLTHELMHLIMAGLILLFFLTLRPRPAKLEKELLLLPEESKLINDPDAVVR